MHRMLLTTRLPTGRMKAWSPTFGGQVLFDRMNEAPRSAPERNDDQQACVER